MQGTLAVVEQGLYSLVGFASTVVLARWLPAADFGALTLAFAGFLMTAGVYNALVLEPATVLGPSTFAHQLEAYLGELPGMHWRVTLPMSAVVAVPSGVLAIAEPGWPLPRVLFATALCLPLLLRIWLVRRIAYILREPHKAVVVNLAYAATVAAGFTALEVMGHLSAVTAIVILGFASGCVSAPALRDLRHGTTQDLALKVTPGSLLRAHWHYGHWILWASLAGAISLELPNFIVGALLGVSAAGVLGAMETAALPAVQALTALGFLVLPTLAADFQTNNISAISKKLRLFSSVIVPLAAIYCLGVIVLYTPLEHLIFGEKYANNSILMAIMAVYPVFMALGLGPSLFLRAVQHPQHYLVANAMIAPVGLAAPLVLTVLFGLPGAAWSFVAIYATAWVVLCILMSRWKRNHADRARTRMTVP